MTTMTTFARLYNIEFWHDNAGKVMLRDDSGVREYRLEERALTDRLFALIEEEYPKAFAALTEIYAKSKANAIYFQFLVVHRFLRCNFGRIDRRLDIDHAGRFVFEEVECPLVGECKYWRVLCSPERDTHLTMRQREVMRLYCDGMSAEDIAERLYISVETVKTTKRNAFDKAGVHDIREFMVKYRDALGAAE